MEQEGISASQIRAARALVGLSQFDLAQLSSFSAMTIKRAEGIGSPYPSAATIASIRAALEAAGVVFLPENGNGPGVALKRP